MRMRVLVILLVVVVIMLFVMFVLMFASKFIHRPKNVGETKTNSIRLE